LWNFFGLSITNAKCSVSIADDDKCGEGEPSTTLNHLGYAIDEYDSLDIRALLSALLTRTALAAIGLCSRSRLVAFWFVVRSH
jgi:hypothetical protein